MSRAVNIPVSGQPLKVEIDQKKRLYVVGANGVGKSHLMQHVYTELKTDVFWMKAHRQNYMSNHTIGITPAHRSQSLLNDYHRNISLSATWTEDSGEDRIQSMLFDLQSLRIERLAKVNEAVSTDDLVQIRQAKLENPDPIAELNEILRLGGINVEISVNNLGAYFASKDGSTEYGINRLSDGEKNALFLAIVVMCSKHSTTILIDEPERHLHRAISAPLLSALFERRSDCSFVVSTHDLDLPLNDPTAHVLLVRGCVFSNRDIRTWDIDYVKHISGIDETVRQSILGSRRGILFVEGDHQSLDRPIYGLLFPELTVISKESCVEVEKAVTSLHGLTEMHWLSVYGIVDSDSRSADDITKLEKKKVFAVPFYSVEALYFHPDVVHSIALKQVHVLGGDAGALAAQAFEEAINSISNIDHLSRRVAEKRIREAYFSQIPNSKTVASGTPVDVHIDVAKYIADERQRLDRLIKDKEYSNILNIYPVRESGFLNAVAKALHFADRAKYQAAVVKLIMDDSKIRNQLRALFPGLIGMIRQKAQPAAMPQKRLEQVQSPPTQS